MANGILYGNLNYNLYIIINYSMRTIGGSGEIRTHGRLLIGCFQDSWVKPLPHTSNNSSTAQIAALPSKFLKVVKIKKTFHLSSLRNNAVVFKNEVFNHLSLAALLTPNRTYFIQQLASKCGIVMHLLGNFQPTTRPYASNYAILGQYFFYFRQIKSFISINQLVVFRTYFA